MAGITVQAPLTYFHEFYKFWKESPYSYNLLSHILQTPKYLRPNLWPDGYRELILSKLEEAKQELVK